MSDSVIHSDDFQRISNGSPGIWARAYYKFKPFIPKGIRWLLRRSRVPKILGQSGDVWPIDESACKMPQGWKGWPFGKQFALVFTHDVESEVGLGKVRALVALEQRFGLCSSFNIIPEGPYKDPVLLRHWLVRNGFEVGVHDLNHDGQLYDSRESFRQKAKSINQYLKEWGAVGFRSGFMLHQLDWLHELNILYDSSTFDTDPFEPQPDGSGTIFPFNARPAQDGYRSGYVELSYTLPQDSTVFLLLREKSPEIWKRKLDWIVRHGGLALVNIHPDYIDFSGNSSSSSCYPVALLEEFMEYVQIEYGDMFWNPLACELAIWFRAESARMTATGRGKVL